MSVGFVDPALLPADRRRSPRPLDPEPSLGRFAAVERSVYLGAFDEALDDVEDGAPSDPPPAGARRRLGIAVRRDGTRVLAQVSSTTRAPAWRECDGELATIVSAFAAGLLGRL